MKSKILIVSARYYKDFSKSLELYAISILKRKKVKYKIVPVPGVFEIPVVIAKNVKKYDGFIALGCVIKGETPHFNFISQTTIDAIMKLSIDYKKPIGNGIITSLNKLQAAYRSKKKGSEAANAVIKVLDNF